MTDQELICDARDHIANRYDTDYKLLIRCFEAVVDRFSALQSENAQQNNSNEVLRAERDELHSSNCKLRSALTRVEAERDAAIHLLDDVWEMLDPDGPEGGYGEAAINMVAYLIYDKVRDYRHRFGVQGEG